MHCHTKGRLPVEGKERQPFLVWSSLDIILSLSKNNSFFSLHVHMSWLWSALERAWKGVICVGKRVAKLAETTVNVQSICWRAKWHLLCALGLHHITSVLGDGLVGSKQMVAMQIQGIYQPWSQSTAKNIRAGILGRQPDFLCKVLSQRLADAVADFFFSLWGWNRFSLQFSSSARERLRQSYLCMGETTPSSRNLFLVWYH